MRSIRRLFLLAATASVLVASTADAQQASVASVSGPAELLRAGERKWAPLPAVTLASKDTIRTATGGTARLVFDDGSVIVLASQSLLRLEEAEAKAGRPRVLLRLLGGQIRVTASRNYGSAGRFEVETPTAVVSVRGTEFIVTYDTGAAETEVACISGSVDVLGVLGVLGKPVVLEPGMGTTVRKGAFPAPPAAVSPDKLAAMRKDEEASASYEDSLIASFTGADTAAVVSPPPLPDSEMPDRRQALRRRPLSVSKDAAIIDQSIQEYTLTPPGVAPPGIVDVVIPPAD